MAGVVTEAIYVHFAVRKTLREQLRPAPVLEHPLTTRAMLAFYIPLSLTQILLLLTSPIGSAAMSRMPLALESLAAWPAVMAVNYITRGFGGAYNEVVVALVEGKGSTAVLRRFGVGLAVAFHRAPRGPHDPSGRERRVRRTAAPGRPRARHRPNQPLRPHPHAGFRGGPELLPGGHPPQPQTSSITESVALFLVVASALLVGGVLWGGMTGLYFALLAFLAGEFLRIFWLWLRSRAAREHLRERDTARPGPSLLSQARAGSLPISWPHRSPPRIIRAPATLQRPPRKCRSPRRTASGLRESRPRPLACERSLRPTAPQPPDSTRLLSRPPA